ncbi:hypothetical protein N7516_003212 [Penicillium verrucosum]|uniref:uncharacterized protein n=1 Tax=Penicillium verrucosum TaxID=60171 RepID=UPI00254566E1|nr:uncharacterized protein N7516_003212 [Penicillium verrucosum]KAJ5943044.1 hypothetical protein N7516_003212 [Penicillium verrucosum]
MNAKALFPHPYPRRSYNAGAKMGKKNPKMLRKNWLEAFAEATYSRLSAEDDSTSDYCSPDINDNPRSHYVRRPAVPK